MTPRSSQEGVAEGRTAAFEGAGLREDGRRETFESLLAASIRCPWDICPRRGAGPDADAGVVPVFTAGLCPGLRGRDGEGELPRKRIFTGRGLQWCMSCLESERAWFRVVWVPRENKREIG